MCTSWFSQYCSRLPPNKPLGMAQRGLIMTTARKKKANIARHMPRTRGGSTRQQSSSCSAQHIFLEHVPPVLKLISVGAAVGMDDGIADGRCVGLWEGAGDGAGVVGRGVGAGDGINVGLGEGLEEGRTVGA